MGKNGLRNWKGRKMNAAGYVDEATSWAKKTVRRESRGPGDYANAMRRIADRYGIPYAALWRLHYKRPKSVVTEIYFALQAAYEAERQRQLKLLKNENKTTAETCGASHNSIRAAQALVDQENQHKD